MGEENGVGIAMNDIGRRQDRNPGLDSCAIKAVDRNRLEGHAKRNGYGWLGCQPHLLER